MPTQIVPGKRPCLVECSSGAALLGMGTATHGRWCPNRKGVEGPVLIWRNSADHLEKDGDNKGLELRTCRVPCLNTAKDVHGRVKTSF